MSRTSFQPPNLQRVRQLVAPVCERHGVARLWVFGSLAQGTAKAGSDIDFMVEFLPEARVGLLEMGTLKEDLEDALDCRSDLVTRAAVERSQNPFRRRSILAELITVYEA